jgi:carbamoyltransferase
VSPDENPRFYALLRAFEAQTGCAVLINTSFNVRGEPPVCTPAQPFRYFMHTDMDFLVLGNFLLDKRAQLANGTLDGLSSRTMSATVAPG